MEEDLKEAISWLSALDPGSEYGATNKEIILSILEEIQKDISYEYEDVKIECCKRGMLIRGLKEYRTQLEKENAELKRLHINIQGMRNGKELLNKYIKDSIPKSVIREKIEELEIEKKCATDLEELIIASEKIDILKELLGD